MNFYQLRFNTYLLLFVATALLAGCHTGGNRDDDNKKQTGILRIHIETTDDRLGSQGSTATIQLPRTEPVNLTIFREPILMENHITQAAVVTDPGGFAIEIQFDQMGAYTLEQFTASNPGKHLVIFGAWGKPDRHDHNTDSPAAGQLQTTTPTNSAVARWLAAPLISHRIANGILAFTPDATRAEADRLVLGLNNVARKIAKGTLQ